MTKHIDKPTLKKPRNYRNNQTTRIIKNSSNNSFNKALSKEPCPATKATPILLIIHCLSPFKNQINSSLKKSPPPKKKKKQKNGVFCFLSKLLPDFLPTFSPLFRPGEAIGRPPGATEALDSDRSGSVTFAELKRACHKVRGRGDVFSLGDNGAGLFF